MESNIDLKNIWQQQKVERPDIEKTIGELKKYTRDSLMKLIITNILLIVTGGIVIFIWYYFQPQLISTKIGITLVILAMLMFLFYYNRLSVTLKKLDTTQSSNDYLQNLNTLVIRQKFIQTKIISLYFIMLSAGICLYMYEYTLKFTVIWTCLSYVITLAWIAVNWFYLRPRIIKKQQQKLNALINQFEKLNQQFVEE